MLLEHANRAGTPERLANLTCEIYTNRHLRVRACVLRVRSSKLHHKAASTQGQRVRVCAAHVVLYSRFEHQFNILALTSATRTLTHACNARARAHRGSQCLAVFISPMRANKNRHFISYVCKLFHEFKMMRILWTPKALNRSNNTRRKVVVSRYSRHPQACAFTPFLIVCRRASVPHCIFFSLSPSPSLSPCAIFLRFLFFGLIVFRCLPTKRGEKHTNTHIHAETTTRCADKLRLRMAHSLPGSDLLV